MAVVVTAVAAAPALAAPPATADPAAMTFAQARHALSAQSPQLAASRKAVESAQLRREAMQGLGGPSVAVTGMAYRYSANAEIDLDPARNALGQVAQQLPATVAASMAQLPALPSTYTLQRQASNASASVSAVWPVYAGGLSDAVRTGLDGMAQEAQADATTTEHSLQRQLVQRYFSAQLAQRAAVLRQRALQAVRAHDDAAQRMLEAGVIAKVERLQASVALADAEQAARKARDDAQLAHTALARTLQVAGTVVPSTPLFVNLQALPELDQWQSWAMQSHPGLRKVAAKRTQAEALHDASEAMRKPKVMAFGVREVNTEGKPNWMVGMAVRWTLWESVDRSKLAAAGERAIEQAELTDAQVRSDIALLVEKNWLAVGHARARYESSASAQALAQELLRLREAGLKEGTSTALDLIDAQLQWAKVQTERAAAANDYVQSLAALLESTGQSDTFEHYLARAEVVIASESP